MKKKIVSLILSLCLCCSAAACGGNTNSGKDQDQASVSESAPEKDDKKSEDNAEAASDESAGISAEKNLFSVEVTLPSYFFEESDELDLIDELDDDEVKDITKNADGSMTFKMTKDAHKELLSSIKETIDESIKEILEDKENYPSFDSISYNEDLTVFDIKVDPAVYGGFESLSAYVFCMYGNMYQALNAVPEGELKTVVNMVNKDTREVIESIDSTSLSEEVSE